MKNLQLLLFSCLFLYTIFSKACTTFVLKNDSSLVFGRNLDWYSDNGMIFQNQRNMAKKSLVFSSDQATEWVSKYGSISFNQFGKEFPFGGMNEKGLVVEIMTVDGNYPKSDDRTALNELQWVQYQLDNSSSIEDVIASDKTIRISKIHQNLHFFVCDALGNSAVIEFFEEGMKVYKDKNLPIPVLENEPYSKSLGNHRGRKTCRFNTAANMLKQYETRPSKSAINYSFDILDKVALDGSWSIVYDIKNMKIHFKTSSNTKLRKFSIANFNFDCKKTAKAYDLQKSDSGSIDDLFLSYNPDLNQKKFKEAIVSNAVILPKEILKMFYNYPNTCTCEKEK